MGASSNPVSPRSRRYVIEALAGGVAISLSGCAGGEGETTETATAEATSPPPDVDTMSKGSLVVEVTVDARFDDSTVLKADCRGEDVSIGSGESARIERRTAGETCAIQLDIATETQFEAEVFDFESYYLTVTEDGAIEKEMVEL